MASPSPYLQQYSFLLSLSSNETLSQKQPIISELESMVPDQKAYIYMYMYIYIINSHSSLPLYRWNWISGNVFDDLVLLLLSDLVTWMFQIFSKFL